MTSSQSNSGVTLLELCVSLIITGMLIGGVLSAVSLFHTARLHAQVDQIHYYMNAFNSFNDKYHGLPGDISNASTFWGIYDPVHNTGAQNGTGTGKIGCQKTSESFRHLVLSGLIQNRMFVYISCGPYQPDVNTPAAALDSSIAVSVAIFDIYGLWQNWFTFGSLSTRAAAWLDSKLDDGVPNAGIFLAAKGFNYAADTNNLCTQGNTRYDAVPTTNLKYNTPSFDPTEYKVPDACTGLIVIMGTTVNLLGNDSGPIGSLI